jgi:hypothetical protein
MTVSEAVKELIQNALDQDYNKASKSFGDIMTVKLSDVLDQETIRLSNTIYNGVEDDEEETDIDDDDQLELDLEGEGESESEEQDDEEDDEVEDNADDDEDSGDEEES